MKLTSFLTISVILLQFHSQKGNCRDLRSDIVNLCYENQIVSALYATDTADPASVKPDSPSVEEFLTTDEEIQQLTEALYSKETDSQLNKIFVNIQGKTSPEDTDDQAPLPLLQVGENALQLPTIVKLRALYDNYEMDTSIEEIVTPAQEKEQNDFLNAVLDTNVMRHAMLFLENKGIVSLNPNSQRDLLREIWFTLYDRGQGAVGSSGFEHVFLNEVHMGKLMGLHNWIYFSEEEKAGRLDYKGYVDKIELENKAITLMARFTLDGLNKPVSSLFVGTSPELDMALYTICFELRPDKLCPVSMGGKKFSIQTEEWSYQGKTMIGSAYPKI